MKKYDKTIFCIIAGILLVSGCASRKADWKQEPKYRLATYAAEIRYDIADKIRPVPDIVLQSMNSADNTDVYKNHPAEPGQVRLILEYFDLLPEPFREIWHDRLAGIYLVENFLGGGMADLCFDDKGNMYMVLFLNPLIFSKSMEEWIDFRDNSPFFDDNSGTEIHSRVSGNFRELLHIMTHETAHMYDSYNHETPYMYPVMKSATPEKESYPFTDGVWADYSIPVKEYDFPGRLDIASYGLGKQLPRSRAQELYRDLAETPFCSLYASRLWVEDFAEWFTWNYLKKTLGISYSVTVSGDEGTFVFTPPEDLSRSTLLN